MPRDNQRAGESADRNKPPDEGAGSESTYEYDGQNRSTYEHDGQNRKHKPMKVITPGYKYELANFEEDVAELNQCLQFIHKVPVAKDSPNLTTLFDGTTNEEVLRVLIDRLQFLQAKFSCRENVIVITKLEEMLMWLEKRTAERKARGVEGKVVA